MKRSVIIISGMLVFLAAAVIAMYQLAPGTILWGLQTGMAWQAGFQNKTVDIDGYTAHYYETGPKNGPVLVLLHGLIDNRNSFVPASAELPGTFRVILPDLQGHGDNAQVAGRDYSIRGQVNFIADLLETLEVEDLIIGGNSMGGHVAAAFALSYPQRVQKLMLLNATGMLLNAPPTYSAYPDGIDVTYMENMYAHVFINPPHIPGPIMGHLAEDLNTKASFYNVLIDQLVDGKDFRLDERIKTLGTPALIIWGTEDRLVPIHYAEAYQSALSNSELRILEAGHAPQMEVPELVGAAMSAFLDED